MESSFMLWTAPIKRVSIVESYQAKRDSLDMQDVRRLQFAHQALPAIIMRRVLVVLC